MGEFHGIGVVGLGVIAERYLSTLADVDGVRIVAAADLVRSRAEAVAERFDGCRALTLDELVADPAVDADSRDRVARRHDQGDGGQRGRAAFDDRRLR